MSEIRVQLVGDIAALGSIPNMQLSGCFWHFRSVESDLILRLQSQDTRSILSVLTLVGG